MVMEIIISVILLFVGIAVLVIIHICVVGRAFRGDPIIHGGSFIESRAERIGSMRAEDIQGLPCFEYQTGDKPGNVDCAVCLENFMTGEVCRILPKCSHVFHAECIDSWLLKTAACPVCRTGAKSSPRFEENSTSFSGEVQAM